MASCLLRFIKGFLVVFNILVLVSGVLLMSLAVWLCVDNRMLVYMEFTHLPPQPDLLPDQAAFCLLGVGCTMIVLSFMACCGAWIESPCFLCIYSSLIIIMLMVEVVCAILAGVLYSQIRHLMENQIRFSYNNTASPDRNFTNPVTTLWDHLQITLECCGASGPHDYQTSTWFNLTRHSDGLFVPQSCCVMRDTAASRPVPLQQRICQHDALLYRPDQPLDSEFLHTRGCYSAFKKSLNGQLGSIAAVSIVIVFIQALNAALSCLLMSRVRQDEALYPPIVVAREEEEALTLQDILTNNHQQRNGNTDKHSTHETMTLNPHCGSVTTLR